MNINYIINYDRICNVDGLDTFSDIESIPIIIFLETILIFVTPKSFLFFYKT